MNTNTNNNVLPLSSILADLSRESPALSACLQMVNNKPYIGVTVSEGVAWAHAMLPVDKLDLYCGLDAQITYSHEPLPHDATPSRLESRANTLRRLESRIERALARIAVAEECGFLEP